MPSGLWAFTPFVGDLLRQGVNETTKLSSEIRFELVQRFS